MSLSPPVLARSPLDEPVLEPDEDDPEEELDEELDEEPPVVELPVVDVLPDEDALLLGELDAVEPPVLLPLPCATVTVRPTFGESAVHLVSVPSTVMVYAVGLKVT